MHPPRPFPIDLKVKDLKDADLEIVCPVCRRRLHCEAYDLQLQLPPDMLLIRYVTRHVCRRCSRPGRKVRCEGQIQPQHRSGAEPKPEGPYPWR